MSDTSGNRYKTYDTGHQEVKGKIRFKGSWGLGLHEDVNGKKWDVHIIIGGFVCARPIDDSPKYSTASWDLNKGWCNIHYVYEAEFNCKDN